MPEPWEIEVRKLRTLTAPTSLSSRVTQGPRGRPPEPPGRRIVTAVVALGLFTAVAAGAWLAFRPVHTGTAASGGPEPADVLVVTCSEDGPPEISTPVVRAHPDGIHVQVRGAPNTEALFIRSASRPGWDLSSGSNGIEDELVVGATPGEAFAGCFSGDPVPEREAGAPQQPDESAFTIVDPTGSWVSTELTCGFDPDTRHFEADRDSAGEPIESAARRAIPGVLDTDVVERAGYPQAGDRQEVRIVRDGEVVAWASGFIFNAESWLFDVTACEGSGIASA